MTEIPFLFYTVCGIYFYLKHREDNRIVFYLLSILFFIMAVLTRQVGLAFVLGLVVSELWQNKSNSKKAILFLFLNVLALFLFELWLYNRDPINGYANVFLKNGNFSGTPTLLNTLFIFSKRWVHYVSICGFVLSPLLINYLVQYAKQNSKKLINKSVVISLVIFIPVVFSFKHFPIGNYIYNCGVGPDTLYDTYICGLHLANTQAPILFYFISIITFISSFGLILAFVNLLETIWSGLKNKDRSNEFFSLIFILVSLFTYYAFLCFTTAILDRYIFIFSVFATMLLMKVVGNSLSKKVIGLAIICLALFSVLSTKDYLNFNRARWQAIDYAKKTYHAQDIDMNGGYEHEGLCFADSLNWAEKWYNKPMNAFMISRGNLPNYSEASYITYQRYIPYKNDSIFILKLNEITPK